MISALALAVIALWIFALGCHSTGVNVTIQNNAKVPLRNVELDYPGATFGTSNIAPGGSFWYHIKPTKDGAVTLSFDEENGKSFKQTGPTVHQGKDERLVLVVDQDAGGKWRISVETNATK